MLKGSLFTREYLIEGIGQSEEWNNLNDKVIENFRDELLEIFNSFPVSGNPIEATTEDDLIKPVIEALGWNDYLTQQTTARKGRDDVPDFLLFPNKKAKQKANEERKQADRYKYGLSFLEAKTWNLPLDRKGNDAAFKEGVPSTQMLRYLSRVEVQSEKQIQWGFLTNGRHWRLYYQGAKSRSEEFLELDLPLILNLKGFGPNLFNQKDLEAQNWLKVFYLIFSKESFLQSRPNNVSFHDFALEEGRHWEAKVAQDLSNIVFNEVFPNLLQGLKAHDPQAPTKPDSIYLSELRDSALTFLYRLLFVLYAEDRGLLPVKDDKYDDYGLRKRVREDIKTRIDQHDTFSATQDDYYRKVCNLFKAIDKGDSSIGLPPYNGGLFDRTSHVLLNRAEIPDAVFAPLLDKLSRREEEGRKKWINYRDLSVQQLGSIYERLLEFEIKIEEDGKLSIVPNIFARKTSGSYYTPEPLVKLILEKAIGPLLDEKLKLFHSKNKDLKSTRKPKKEKIKELAKSDPAMTMLELRVCDPAMGSGHFLVSLVDYLADRALEAMAESEESVEWQDEKAPYISPLTEKIYSIREQILEQANQNGWVIDKEQLDDRHIVRRMILKRCIYGVDKNPMAVELAKVALWLHTFTVGAPLSFLDHHLRCGDSLFGEFVRGVEDFLQDRSSLFISSALAKAKQTAKGMAQIEEITDADISEVQESANKFNIIDSATRQLRTFFSFIHAISWLDTSNRDIKRAVQSILDETYGEPVKLVTGKEEILDNAPEAVHQVLAQARELYEEERFLHWEITFPGIWDQWENIEPLGGFDAVIGNPPWDRIKLQEVEWFSNRKPEIALAVRASDRKNLIKQLEENNDPLWQDYLKARDRAQAMAAIARGGGQFPLLSSGDINIYSLFVERAHRLIKPEGMVGLLCPSGIASDKYASNFFKSISTTGRLAGLYDFENKKIFFPDIDSRFKFCTYIAGGKKRTFPETPMAFFLHDTEEINDPERCFALSHEDFERVNPNTGTAPIFRTRRDAEITRRIYEKFPVLSHHQKGKVWPVKYLRMFDMTNDSHLFKTKEELEKSGFYPVEGNRLKKGREEFVPLYVGKMIHQYDHRAASVEVNLDSLHNPALSDVVSEDMHKNPEFFPYPQYWVGQDNISLD
ncbi:MAG: Eco57I restriction-modification methylase domain-containing protein [Proteobacteria bacterium]|nr:Eco57I restriction-modification methylase domain-containing protein [Pseudomonadota bacterium]